MHSSENAFKYVKQKMFPLYDYTTLYKWILWSYDDLNYNKWLMQKLFAFMTFNNIVKRMNSYYEKFIIKWMHNFITNEMIKIYKIQSIDKIESIRSLFLFFCANNSTERQMMKTNRELRQHFIRCKHLVFLFLLWWKDCWVNDFSLAVSLIAWFGLLGPQYS
jgi:hypothetical protein